MVNMSLSYLLCILLLWAYKMVTDALYDNSQKLKNSETFYISPKEDPTESFQNFEDIKALNPIYK